MILARHNWWITLLEGLALVVFGFLAVSLPGLTVVLLSFIFSYYTLSAGILNLLRAASSIRLRRSWPFSLILGMAQLFIGAFLLRSAGLAVSVFILVIGYYFILQGLMQILIPYAGSSTYSRPLLNVGGILAVITGFFILRFPAGGSLAYAWLPGVYGIINGAFLIAVALGMYEGVRRPQPAKR